MQEDRYKDRSIVVIVLLILVAVIFIVRLATLQFSDEYEEKADGNAFYHRIVYAPRGAIMDRNGKLLVYNQRTYDLLVVVKTLDDLARNGTPFDTLALCDVLDEDITRVRQRFADVKNFGRNPGYSPLTPQRFATQLSPEEYAQVREQMRKFPGFSVQSRTLRNYEYNAAAHILGSIGEVNQEQLDNDKSYRMGDYIGVAGIEKSYERELRGQNGDEILLRDARGRIQGSYMDGAYDHEAIPGENVISTLDIDLQMFAEKLLNGKRGSIVAIEPQTGEVLVMASSPTWNPEYMVGRKRGTYYPILINEKTRPLINRAIQGRYSPGSTFKTLQALVCLQLGGITEYDRFPCNGPNSTPIKCTHHHGSPVSLMNAIEQSCNPFFWAAYKNTIEKDCYVNKRFSHERFHENYNRWRDAMMSFGLGFAFEDSDIPGLKHGAIGSETTYNRLYGQTGWRAITVRSNSIGQGEVEVTPIQLANAIAVIANGGWYITPHVNKNDSMLTRKHYSAVTEKRYYDIVQEGMWRVCEFGTGRHYKVPGIEMCGKTGTVQNSGGEDHSLFVGYAPYHNPKIVIAVVVENAGFGATWANPIASLIIEQYLTGKCTRKDVYDDIAETVKDSRVKEFDEYIKSVAGVTNDTTSTRNATEARKSTK